MAANNETGVVGRIRAVADAVHAAGGTFLCDTAQAFGRMPIDVEADGIDFAVVAAHKVHGPKGAGALLVRTQALLDGIEPLIVGAQERGHRGGTLDVAAIVGLGEACRLARQDLGEDVVRIASLRTRLEDGILAQVPDTWVNGDRAHRLCNTSNIGFRGVEARILIRDMHDVAVSTRSACSSGSDRPSHVLTAIGLSDADAWSCVRFSLGRFTTRDEIDRTIEKVASSVQKLRRFGTAG